MGDGGVAKRDEAASQDVASSVEGAKGPFVMDACAVLDAVFARSAKSQGLPPSDPGVVFERQITLRFMEHPEYFIMDAWPQSTVCLGILHDTINDIPMEHGILGDNMLVASGFFPEFVSGIFPYYRGEPEALDKRIKAYIRDRYVKSEEPLVAKYRRHIAQEMDAYYACMRGAAFLLAETAPLYGVGKETQGIPDVLPPSFFFK